MLGAEEHRAEAADDIRHLLGAKVVLLGDLLFVANKLNFYVIIAPLVAIVERDLGMLLAEFYHLADVRCAKASAHRRIEYRLEQIGLALRVLAVKDVNAG